MKRSLLALVVVVAGLLATAAPAGAVSSAPAYPGDFPDPFVLVVGTSYWAYSTGSAGRNLQVMRSTDMKTWTAPSDPLPTLPSWASPDFTWAPGVVRRSTGFLMYYTVRDTASGRQCVSVAASAVPAGPFTDSSSGPLVCQLTNGGSIDPSPFVTSTGTYLLWKSDDNALGQPTHLWSQPLSADGRSLVGTRALLLTQDRPWQGGVIEGPSMFLVGGTYYLFYGAGPWDSSSAGIGYARCSSPLGPCTNASVNGSLRIAYHAWTGGVGYQNGGVRSLWIDRLLFLLGTPVVA